jgi:hypothetical protein
MQEANRSRIESLAGSSHQDGRPFHFSSLNQEGRIRKVFGLSEESPLPPVREDTLAAYHAYLADHLSLPFDALCCENGVEVRQLVHYIQIIELLPPRKNRSGSLQGLCCKARNHKATLELSLAECGVREDNPNCQLVDDYAYWYVNWR